MAPKNFIKRRTVVSRDLKKHDFNALKHVGNAFLTRKQRVENR
jgi:hypothetical protein